MNKHLVPAICAALAWGLAIATPVAANDAQLQTSVATSTNAKYTLVKGTADYENARKWVQGALQAANGEFGPASNADSTNIGGVIHVTVVHNSVQSGKSIAMDPISPAPPWTPGIDGSSKKGDTASISTCGGGWAQTWDLTVEQDATTGALTWVVTGYSKARKQYCSGQ